MHVYCLIKEVNTNALHFMVKIHIPRTIGNKCFIKRIKICADNIIHTLNISMRVMNLHHVIYIVNFKHLVLG